MTVRHVAATIALIIYAAAEAVFGMLRAIAARSIDTDARREIWFRFALWIILALAFALAADIIRSAIAPSWESIGRLAAIGAIRTGLNWLQVPRLVHKAGATLKNGGAVGRRLRPSERRAPRAIA